MPPVATLKLGIVWEIGISPICSQESPHDLAKTTSVTDGSLTGRRMVKEEGAQWLHKMEFDIPYNIWKTENPPTTWYSDDYDWQTLLWNRYWVDRSGNWIGPEWAAENKGKGRDKGSWWTPSAAANKWAELLADPDGYAWNAQTKSYEPITRCAEQLVVDWNHFDWNGRHSQRIWSVRNKAIALYKKRSFQNDPADNVAA